MNGTGGLIMVFSMLLSALIGSFGILLFGGKTSMNYLKVKVSRGRKVLLIARTKFGWRTFVAKKQENTLEWKYDKKPQKTTIQEGDVTRYMRIDAVFVDADKSGSAIKIKDDTLYPSDFDPETFNNLLIRALTRPSPDGADELKKLILIAVVLGVLILIGVIAVYVKLGDLAPVVASAVI